METFIDKLTSYNLFNYLFPGIVFCLIGDNYLSTTLLQDNLFVGLFLYYFVGLICSRVGSLIVEPTFKKLKVVTFTKYSNYVKADAKDKKVGLLSEQNNTYRTIIGMIVSLFLIKFYNLLAVNFNWFEKNNFTVLLIVILILFAFSYRKQTNYVRDRVIANLDE